MKKLLKTSFFVLLLIGLFSCHSTKNVTGTYINKFAVNGFFGTTIRLMKDSSFQYVFQGDLMYDSATGHYQIYDNRLYLSFDKQPYDSTKLYYRFNSMPLKKEVHSYDTIKYKLSYIIRHNKLFPINVETGKKITKAWGYNKLKKYIFFGSHYYNKRYYLKRIK